MAPPEGARRVRLRALSLRGLRFSVDVEAARVTVTREADGEDGGGGGGGGVGGGGFVSEGALLRTARRLAAEHAASAARAARGWLWDSAQAPSLEAAAELFGDERANSGAEDGAQHAGAAGAGQAGQAEEAEEADLASLGATPADMARARPWLDVLAHESRDAPPRRAVLGVQDEAGARVALRRAGDAASWALGETLFVYVAAEGEESEEGGAGAGNVLDV